eukprot:scaffold4914_cov152-Pinguiococcus_pyrenoidosus.AAC.3
MNSLKLRKLTILISYVPSMRGASSRKPSFVRGATAPPDGGSADRIAASASDNARHSTIHVEARSVRPKSTVSSFAANMPFVPVIPAKSKCPCASDSIPARWVRTGDVKSYVRTCFESTLAFISISLE